MINNTEQTLYRLSVLNEQQQRVDYQTRTKKQLQNGSDDALLYSREILVEDKMRVYTSIQNQLHRTTAQNDVADSSIVSMKKILETLKADMIKANSSTTTDDGLQVIAKKIEGLRDSLLTLANSQTEGEYLFSGLDSSVRPFVKNETTGKIEYQGTIELRKVAVDENLYKDRGINGLDLMFYPSSTAHKGEGLSFEATDKIIDQDNNEWKFDAVNSRIQRFDFEGNVAETINGVVADTTVSPTKYNVTIPASRDGAKFQAKTNIFDTMDNMINALKKVDGLGNPISDAKAKELISQGVENAGKIFNSVNDAHVKLGAIGGYFKVASDSINAKHTQYEVLYNNISSVNYTQVALESKSLELIFTAMYSTINRTNQLSLVNFLK